MSFRGDQVVDLLGEGHGKDCAQQHTVHEVPVGTEDLDSVKELGIVGAAARQL